MFFILHQGVAYGLGARPVVLCTYLRRPVAVYIEVMTIWAYSAALTSLPSELFLVPAFLRATSTLT